jgi:hypothetical protein
MNKKMALKADSRSSSHFFETGGVVLDSCGVTWFLRRPAGIAELNAIQKTLSLIVPLPVLYEVGFGKQEDVSENEK